MSHEHPTEHLPTEGTTPSLGSSGSTLEGLGTMAGAIRSQRGCRRHKRRVKVTVGQSASYTVDLGCGGFSFESLRVLAPGSAVAGTVHEPSAEVRFSGTVIWAKPGDAYLGLRGRMGVRFTTVAPVGASPTWLAHEPDSRARGAA